MPRIILLHTEPIDYRMPFFRGVQNRYRDDCEIIFFKKRLMRSCISLLQAKDVRVVVVCGAHALGVPIVYFFARLCSARIVFFTETWNWGRWNVKTFLYRMIIGFLACRSDIVTYPGEKVRAWYRELGIFDDRMIHVPNASFDYSFVRRIPRESGGLMCVACISRGMKRKGLIYLYQAMRELGDKYVLIGGRVHRNDVAGVFARAHVYVYPSIRSTGEGEAWGLAVNEALSAGIPVVATEAVASGYNLIMEGKNGFIVKEESGASLAEGIRRAVQLDPEVVRRTSQDKIKLYSFEAMSDGMCRAINQLL